MVRRYLRDQDLVPCLTVKWTRAGEGVIGRERTIEAWKLLTAQRSFAACVIEDRAGGRITGFGSAVFVTEDFAMREIQDPRPGLNARLIQSIAAGTPVTLDGEQLARENARANLHLVVLYAHWLEHGLTREQVGEVQMHNAHNFLEQHAGYRIKQMISELFDQADLDHAESLMAWKVVSRYEDYFKQHPESPLNRDRGLTISNKETSLENPGSVASPVFLHRTPVLGFSDSEQMLLMLTLRGLRDEEIAGQLRRSQAALKWAWGSIFTKVSKVFPEYLQFGREKARGPEKRTRVLAYVKEHPEELRPYRRPKR